MQIEIVLQDSAHLIASHTCLDEKVVVDPSNLCLRCIIDNKIVSVRINATTQPGTKAVSAGQSIGRNDEGCDG